MSLSFRNKRFATIQSSWLEPRKVREMTIVGTRRMIVYDDLAAAGKDPQSTTCGWSGRRTTTRSPSSITPIITGTATSRTFKQEEPLKVECQHFLDCIERGCEAV